MDCVQLDSEGDRSKVFTGVPNFANRRQLMLKYMVQYSDFRDDEASLVSV